MKKMTPNGRDIDVVNVFHDADGHWYYSAWVGNTHNHNDSLEFDTFTADAAIAEAKAYFPNADVRVVEPVA
jgi:hypothetical protein